MIGKLSKKESFMLAQREYSRARAVEYARRWALSRNPLYYDYTGIGGNCTNFVSQCVYAGCCTMNYTPDFGWYYISATDRAPAYRPPKEPDRWELLAERVGADMQRHGFSDEEIKRTKSIIIRH
jgi:hypothetical protein